MKTKLFVFAAWSAVTYTASAAVLINLPTPMAQGGMIHINVSLQGSSLFADVDSGTPELRPLSMWSPGDTFSPTSPWYTTLDPQQSGGLFNSQFGLVIDGTLSDPLPPGARILIGISSASPGLETYRWRNNAPQLFDAILGTGGSDAEWDWSTVNHGMMHPMFVAPSGTSGALSTTLTFTLADASGVPLAGYTGTSAVLDFTSIPEPATAGLVALSLLCSVARRRRQMASELPTSSEA